MIKDIRVLIVITMRVQVALALIVTISCIAVQIHPKQQRCFNVEGGADYDIQYIVAGYNENNVNFTITHDTQLILHKEALKQFKDTVTLPQGISSLCFNITDEYSKMLIVDFFPTTDLIKTLITKKSLNEVGEGLREAFLELKTVYRNQQFQTERDKVHKELLEETEGKIKYSGIFKVLMLLGSALVQVWVMKRFFSSRSREYQSVEM